MSDAKAALPAFLTWLSAQGASVEGCCSIVPAESGLGVVATRDIQPDELLARLPKHCLLSVRTTSVARVLADLGLDEVEGVGLTVAVMMERARGDVSPWRAYFATLPEREYLPMFWTEEERGRLRGTEAAGAGEWDAAVTEDHYTTLVEPNLPRLCRAAGLPPPSTTPKSKGNTAHKGDGSGKKSADKRSTTKSPNDDELATKKDVDHLSSSLLSLDAYRHAASLVASRSFAVDDYHGDSMVPIADIFNHKASVVDLDGGWEVFVTRYAFEYGDGSDGEGGGLGGSKGRKDPRLADDPSLGLEIAIRSLDDDSDGQSGSGSESEHEHGSGGEGANGGESGGDGEHEGEGDSEIEMGEEQGDDRGSESGSEDGNEGEHASGGDSEGGGESEGGREHESGNGDGSESGGDGDNNGVASGWLEIVAARAIASGCEIFNTYGEYSNAKLLQKYGFCVQANPFTEIAINKAGLLQSLQQAWPTLSVNAGMSVNANERKGRGKRRKKAGGGWAEREAWIRSHTCLLDVDEDGDPSEPFHVVSGGNNTGVYLNQSLFVFLFLATWGAGDGGEAWRGGVGEAMAELGRLCNGEGEGEVGRGGVKGGGLGGEGGRGRGAEVASGGGGNGEVDKRGGGQSQWDKSDAVVYYTCLLRALPPLALAALRDACKARDGAYGCSGEEDNSNLQSLEMHSSTKDEKGGASEAQRAAMGAAVLRVTEREALARVFAVCDHALP